MSVGSSKPMRSRYWVRDPKYPSSAPSPSPSMTTGELPELVVAGVPVVDGVSLVVHQVDPPGAGNGVENFKIAVGVDIEGLQRLIGSGIGLAPDNAPVGGAPQLEQVVRSGIEEDFAGAVSVVVDAGRGEAVISGGDGILLGEDVVGAGPGDRRGLRPRQTVRRFARRLGLRRKATPGRFPPGSDGAMCNPDRRR